MMEKKYELVAWTENVNHPENARLYMIPSLDWEMQAPYFNEIGECHSAMRDNKGVINVGLARKLAKAYEDNANFFFFTGHAGRGIRFTLNAARYCLSSNNVKHALYGEFIRLCEKAIKLANLHRRTDVLLEDASKEVLKHYFK